MPLIPETPLDVSFDDDDSRVTFQLQEQADQLEDDRKLAALRIAEVMIAVEGLARDVGTLLR